MKPSSATALRPGSPSAAAAIWPWRTRSSSLDAARARDRLRKEGVIRTLVGGAAGGLFFAFGSPTVARVAWSVSGFVLLAALLSPTGVYAAIGRFLGLFGRVVGKVLAVLFLTPAFYLVFLPFGLLFRRGRNDRLERWFDRAAPTYWHRREDAPRTRASYEKAF
ncbi:MAG: hypothetical protein ABI639_16595 [Thermoanaerobaculia bacterium]